MRDSVPAFLWYQFRALTSSAQLGVRALNFQVFHTCLLAEDESSAIISSKLIEILLSLNALCAVAPTRAEILHVTVNGVANKDSAWFNQASFPEFQKYLHQTVLLFFWSLQEKCHLPRRI